MADVAAAADVVGSPAQPVRDFFRQVATLKKLARAARTGSGRRGRTRTTGAMNETTPAAAATAGETIDLIDIARIMHAIPHRYPFLMIDRVVDVVRNQSAIGVKNVSVNEHSSRATFPAIRSCPAC